MNLVIAQIVALVIVIGGSLALYYLGMTFGLPFCLGFLTCGVLVQLAYKAKHGEWFD